MKEKNMNILISSIKGTMIHKPPCIIPLNEIAFFEENFFNISFAKIITKIEPIAKVDRIYPIPT